MYDNQYTRIVRCAERAARAQEGVTGRTCPMSSVVLRSARDASRLNFVHFRLYIIP